MFSLNNPGSFSRTSDEPGLPRYSAIEPPEQCPLAREATFQALRRRMAEGRTPAPANDEGDAVAPPSPVIA